MDASDTDDSPRDYVRAPPRRHAAEKFSAAMRTFLLSEVMENWAVVTDPRIDDRAVYNKRRAWASIEAQFNARFPHGRRSQQQLRDLWKRHSIQFRKEGREEMELDEAAAAAVPNELIFQKLLEWLEVNTGAGGAEDAEDAEEEGGSPRKASRGEDDDLRLELPPSPNSRADTPSADSNCSVEESGPGLEVSSRKAAEILSSADKHYLIVRCFRSYDVIGSSRLDSPALRQKRKTWVEICTEYNRKFGRNLGVSTVKGVWRRFVKQRKDDLMKTLKLRNKEDVTEEALMEDMRTYLSNYMAQGEREACEDLPLYKQIQADVEERPLTASQRAHKQAPEQILSQIRKVTPAPPPLQAADGGAVVRRPTATPVEEPDEGALMSEEEIDCGGALDPRDRLGSDVSITVVDPESRPPSRDVPAPRPAQVAPPAAAALRPPPLSCGPRGPTGAPLAAGAGTAPPAAVVERLAREKHQIELLQLREKHQMALQQLREKHQWEMEKARLEAEILSMQREYWRVQLEQARTGAAAAANGAALV